MEVKIKKVSKEAVVPRYAKPGDAGMDLTVVAKDVDEFGNIVYHSGLAFEIPEGYVGLVTPRSSISKYDLMLTNNVGIIDSGYRGEVTGKFKLLPKKNDTELSKVYEVGDRFAQMIIMPFPHIEFVEVEELSQTERGDGGYGSTGN